MNIIAITGNLTADPELRTTAQGTTLCHFTVAVRRPGARDKTDFFPCVAWRERGEFVCKYFKKGQRIEVNGAMVSREWEDAGKKRISWEINAGEVGFGGKGGTAEEKPHTVSPEEYKATHFEELREDEDLPF